MVNDVPIAAFGSSGAATRINNATIAEVRGFASAKCAATGHPAGARRWRRRAEITAKGEINEGSIFGKHINFFAIRVELCACRQCGFIHTDGVTANGWNLQDGNSQAVG